MDSMGNIIACIIPCGLGFGLQFLIQWSPGMNLLFSFIFALTLPPWWSLGLIIGCWISCAFFTYNPEKEGQYEAIAAINWQRILWASLWTFAGFLLTLVFLWRVKIGNWMEIYPREILGWFFLALVEICLCRVLAKLVPRLYRIPLGYGIGALNFLMLLLWIFSFDIWKMGLILLSLLIVYPLILVLVDLPLNSQDPIFRRK